MQRGVVVFFLLSASIAVRADQEDEFSTVFSMSAAASFKFNTSEHAKGAHNEGFDGPHVVKSPPPSPKKPVERAFPIDFSTTESSLRTFVLLSDVAGAANTLGSPRAISLGAGLTYPEELSPLVEPTSERNRDPDVVAFKALAKSALETHEAFKLATAVTLSFTPDCECSKLDDIREAFARVFMDKKEMLRILSADANTELTRQGRRLQQGSSPVTSFVCASCWPIDSCSIMRWC